MNPTLPPTPPPFAGFTAPANFHTPDSGSRRRIGFALLAATFVILNSSFVIAQLPDPAAHTVIIPYTGSPLTQTPNRYYLGYDEFQRLWSLAKENRKPPLPAKDSEALVIHQALYEARIEERGLVITARISAVTRGFWTKLALPFVRIENDKETTPALVGEMTVDGKSAALIGGMLTLEDPGAHDITLTATLPMPASWDALKLRLPSAMAGVLALHTPKSDGWPRINGQAALTVEEKPAARLFTHALGLHSELQLTRTARGMDRGEGPVPAARVEGQLTLQALEPPAVDARLHYEFPGATRRTLSFSIDITRLHLDEISVVADDKRVELSRIESRTENGRAIFTLHLRHEITGSADVRLRATATAQQDGFHAPLPDARRITQKLTLSHDAASEITVKPEEGQQRVAAATLTWQFTGTGPLRFSTKEAAPFESADASYVFQLSEQKAELLAALALKRQHGGWTRAEIGLPEGYEVQTVQGPAVAAWQQDGGSIFVHLHPQVAGQEARLVVHLVRTLAQPATTWQLTPLVLKGYAKLTARALIVAHAATDVKLPDLTQRSDIQELDATALDSVFAIAPPMEKKRALKLEGGTWSTSVTLTRQPVRFAADGIALVLASDAGIRFSQQLAVQVEQGALRQVSLRLPAALPEAVVTGPLLREMRTRVENGQRIYDCSFQTDVLDRAALTFDIDLPLSSDFDVPFVQVADAARLTRWFVLDNASAREATITTQTGLETVSREALPYLPAGLARPEFYRATEDGTLKLAYQQLTSTEGNAALITLADLTTLLRADGQRWDTARYSLINRSLQFLPVILPPEAELITVSVSGAPVRADEENQGGRRVRLIPLIHTRPGQRALEVKLVYRFPASTSELPASLKLDDPELPGLSVERTTWTVWTPNGHRLADFDGNMQEVGAEGRDLQQLEGMLSELGETNRVLARGDLDDDSARQAYEAAKDLTTKVQEKKRKTLDSIVSNGLESLLSGRYERSLEQDRRGAAPAMDDMDKEVAQQGKLLEDNWKSYVGSKGKPQAKNANSGSNTYWDLNEPVIDQKLTLSGSNTFSGSITTNGGQLFNDNIAVDNTYFGNQGAALAITPLKDGLEKSAAEAAPSGLRSGGYDITINSIDKLLPKAAAVPQTAQQPQSTAFNNGVNSNARANNLSQGGELPAIGDDRRDTEIRRETTIPPAEALGSPLRAQAGTRSAPGPINQEPPSSADPFGAPPPAAPAPAQLKSSGRHALDIDLPADGTVHHFSKLKDHAVLEIDLRPLTAPHTTSRLIYLTLGLLLWFILWRWSSKRQQLRA